MLKQITASLIYPEDEIGKKFWKRIYEEAAKKFGTTNIPVNTFNKVWIIPEKAVVYENAKAGTAYVVESKLKVMLEQDYLSLQKHSKYTKSKQLGLLGANIVREIVIPELTKEVNEDKNFAQLRQVYNSLILATWYKKKIKDSILEQVYADKNKVNGIGYNTSDNKKNDVESIYQRYLQAFKKGVFNYIKEEPDPMTQGTIPRKYFSGGENFSSTSLILDEAMATIHDVDFAQTNQKHLQVVSVDFAMASSPVRLPTLSGLGFVIGPPATVFKRKNDMEYLIKGSLPDVTHLVIKRAGSKVIVPEEFLPIEDIIQTVIDRARANDPFFEDRYIYLTVHEKDYDAINIDPNERDYTVAMTEQAKEEPVKQITLRFTIDLSDKYIGRPGTTPSPFDLKLYPLPKHPKHPPKEITNVNSAQLAKGDAAMNIYVPRKFTSAEAVIYFEGIMLQPKMAGKRTPGLVRMNVNRGDLLMTIVLNDKVSHSQLVKVAHTNSGYSDQGEWINLALGWNKEGKLDFISLLPPTMKYPNVEYSPPMLQFLGLSREAVPFDFNNIQYQKDIRKELIIIHRLIQEAAIQKEIDPNKVEALATEIMKDIKSPVTSLNKITELNVGDRAMNIQKNGGIDLTPAYMNLQTKMDSRWSLPPNVFVDGGDLALYLAADKFGVALPKAEVKYGTKEKLKDKAMANKPSNNQRINMDGRRVFLRWRKLIDSEFGSGGEKNHDSYYQTLYNSFHVELEADIRKKFGLFKFINPFVYMSVLWRVHTTVGWRYSGWDILQASLDHHFDENPLLDFLDESMKGIIGKSYSTVDRYPEQYWRIQEESDKKFKFFAENYKNTGKVQVFHLGIIGAGFGFEPIEMVLKLQERLQQVIKQTNVPEGAVDFKIIVMDKQSRVYEKIENNEILYPEDLFSSALWGHYKEFFESTPMGKKRGEFLNRHLEFTTMDLTKPKTWYNGDSFDGLLIHNVFMYINPKFNWKDDFEDDKEDQIKRTQKWNPGYVARTQKLMSYLDSKISKGGFFSIIFEYEINPVLEDEMVKVFNSGKEYSEEVPTEFGGYYRIFHKVKDSNEAMSATMSIKNIGGIDLTPANMNLQTQNSNGEIKFHLNPAMLQQLQNAPGFVPVIISVQPLNDLKSFLGVDVLDSR